MGSHTMHDASGYPMYAKRPQGPFNFSQYFKWIFSEFFGLLTSKNSGIGSIFRLNAWYHLKAEKISNQNIQDPLGHFLENIYLVPN